MPSPDEPIEGSTAGAEEAASELRHALRNSLSTIRNAVFYVRRKVRASEAYGSDPRLERFFEVVEREVEKASMLVARSTERGRRGEDEADAGAGRERGTAHLLLADDDESNRITLAALLEDEGYSIDLAASCADVRGRLLAGSRYDLVVLDQHLGDGLGSELVPLVRAEIPGVRVVLLTGADTTAEGLAIDGRFAKGDPPEALFRGLRGILFGPLERRG